MNSCENKKIAAAIAAVNLYLEEESCYAERPEVLKPVVSVSPWSAFGRSFSMNQRIMWQSKLYK